MYHMEQLLFVGICRALCEIINTRSHQQTLFSCLVTSMFLSMYFCWNNFKDAAILNLGKSGIDHHKLGAFEAKTYKWGCGDKLLPFGSWTNGIWRMWSALTFNRNGRMIEAMIIISPVAMTAYWGWKQHFLAYTMEFEADIQNKFHFVTIMSKKFQPIASILYDLCWINTEISISL